MRTKSFIALTDSPFGSHSGSTRDAWRARRRPSARRSRSGSTRCRRARGRRATAARRHLVVVVGRRAEPGGVRWNTSSSPTIGRDLGDELHRARAGADHRDALAREVDVVVPARPSGTTARRTSSRPGDVRERRAVELADRADDRVGLERLLACRRRSRTRTVQRQRRRPTTSADSDLGPEADVLAQVERVGAAPEVVEQHVLGREVERPVVALRERVAVVVVRVVDAAARIRVLEPGAADVVVLLEDHERHAGLLQPVGGEQARHAGADDQRRRSRRPARARRAASPARGGPRRGRRAPPRAAGGTRAISAPPTANSMICSSASSAGGGAGSHPVAEARSSASSASSRAVACCSSVSPPCGMREQQRVGPQVVAQQRQVAGRVGERGQQRRQLGVVEARGSRRRTRGDRLDRRATNGLDVTSSVSSAHSRSTPFGACCFMKPNR